MLKIGNYNILEVVKLVDFGVYLDGGNGLEILLPTRYIESPLHVGDKIEVFIYTDSEDRLIATTLRPLATVGEFAFLRVQQVNKIGAFVDCGLAKDILVPFREQKMRMIQGRSYLVYLYLDDASKRIAASSKIEKFFNNTYPEYCKGQKVQALVYRKNEIGYNVIINNLHSGMIYDNEIFSNINIGDYVTAYIKNVRDDGKIDLTLSDKIENRIEILSGRILKYMEISNNRLGINDNSSPEEIKAIFGCSKKDFKKAIGYLYKSRKIKIEDDIISLI